VSNHADKKNRDQSYLKKNWTKQAIPDEDGNCKKHLIKSLSPDDPKQERSYYCRVVFLPGAKMLVRHLVGEDATTKLNIVPISKHKAERHIQEMSSYY